MKKIELHNVLTDVKLLQGPAISTATGAANSTNGAVIPAIIDGDPLNRNS